MQRCSSPCSPCGVRFYCEKPLTNDPVAGEALARAAPERLFVMDKWRYHPGIAELSRIASDQGLGPPVGLTTVRIGWGLPHDDVDAVWVLAPHDLSIALEVTGTIPRPRSAVGQSENGRLLSLSALLDAGEIWHAFTVSTRSPVRSRRVELDCERGIAILADAWDEHISVFAADAAEPEEQRIETPGELPSSPASGRSSSTSVVVRRRSRPPRRQQRDRCPRAVARAGGAFLIDATILIPTFRHAALLPYAIDSALDQEGATIELSWSETASRMRRARSSLATRTTRACAFSISRRGRGWARATGTPCCGRRPVGSSPIYPTTTCSSQVMFARCSSCSTTPDFAHPPSVRFDIDGRLQFFPWSYERAEFAEIARGRRGSIGLTGASHTTDAYRRLPYGWRVTPEGMPTDHWMWLQFLDLPGFRARAGTRLTYLTFPDPVWRTLAEERRAEVLASWFRRSREPGFAAELDVMLRDAIRRAAEEYHLWARAEQLRVEAMRATRTWRMRTRLLGVGPSARSSVAVASRRYSPDGEHC